MELTSRIAETEIVESSSVTHSDVESQRGTRNPLENFEQKGIKVNLFNPKASFIHLESVTKSKPVLETAVQDESTMSVMSSVWGDDRDFISTSGSENWEVPSSQILEQLSKTGSKGSHRSEVQLR